MAEIIIEKFEPKRSESQEQQSLIQQCRMQEQIYPDLAGLHSVPNGRFNARSGSRFKAEGSLAGVADLFLPLAKGGYYGFYIEMKGFDKNGKPGRQSKSQKWFEEHVKARGYKYELCWSADEAWQALMSYISNEEIE